VRVGKRNRYPAEAVSEFVKSARTPQPETRHGDY
jgi:hypothetical protein